MEQFNEGKIEMFLAVVRKYMQLRGGMTQKDLAEQTGIGVSTMSRFINQKTSELNEQLIVKIVACLNIPLHEIIDFVHESYADKFIRLVKFHRNEDPALNSPSESDTAKKDIAAEIRIGGRTQKVIYQSDKPQGEIELSIKDKLNRLTTRQKGFINDFLDLDLDARDLVADMGTNIINYLRRKSVDF